MKTMINALGLALLFTSLTSLANDEASDARQSAQQGTLELPITADSESANQGDEKASGGAWNFEGELGSFLVEVVTLNRQHAEKGCSNSETDKEAMTAILSLFDEVDEEEINASESAPLPTAEAECMKKTLDSLESSSLNTALRKLFVLDEAMED